MPKAVLQWSIWKHYKNNESYIVSEVVVNPNTEDLFVVYGRLSAAIGERKYVRPLDEFWEKFKEVDPGRDTSAPKSFA